MFIYCARRANTMSVPIRISCRPSGKMMLQMIETNHYKSRSVRAAAAERCSRARTSEMRFCGAIGTTSRVSKMKMIIETSKTFIGKSFGHRKYGTYLPAKLAARRPRKSERTKRDGQITLKSSNKISRNWIRDENIHGNS